VAYFADEQEVYEHIGRLLVGLANDDDLVARVQKADTVIQYVYRDPAATITVSIKAGEPAQVDLGATSLTPEVVLSMDADTAHRFWLGQVNITVALARGQIRARGPVAKVLRLVPLIQPAFPRYRAQLEAAGREDLMLVP
jgi:putative sterol carrier protein